jgi:hypothetical protein
MANFDQFKGATTSTNNFLGNKTQFLKNEINKHHHQFLQ